MFYRTASKQPKKFVIEDETALAEEECFAEKAKAWITILAVIVAVLLVIGFHRFYQKVGKQAKNMPAWCNPAARTVALRACPYCNGVLDNRGRCNVPGCPLYMPGAALAAPAAPNAQILTIPELAMDIVQDPTDLNVVIQTVYAGGRAEAAGLAPGDVVVRFNGRKIRDPLQFQDIVSQALPETNVKIVFLRQGMPQETLIQIGEGEFAPPPLPPDTFPNRRPNAVAPVPLAQPAVW